MFQHPAYTSNPRHAYGELGGFDFYAFLLPNGFTLGSKGEDIAYFLKSKGVVLEADNKLPNGTIMLIETGAPGLSNYDVLSVNGVPLKFTISGRSVLLGGMGNGALADTLENLLEDLAQKKEYSSGGKENRTDAEAVMWTMWKTSPAKAVQSGGAPSSASATSESDVSQDEVEAILAKTGGYDTSAAAPATSEKPKTGYYTDSGGYAWYYNAEKDYMEAVAAPKGAFSTQPRFDASKGADKYTKMKGVLTAEAFKGADRSGRAAAVANAAAQGGVELPATAAGRPAPASAPPADVAARGEQKLEEKKQVKKGFRGVVSAVPTWAWVTLGTVTLLGGGYYGYRLYKQNA